jgi:hypothetical protein
LSDLFFLKAYLLEKQGYSKASLKSIKTILFMAQAAQQTQFFNDEFVASAINRMVLSRLIQIAGAMDTQLVEKELLPVLKENGLENGFRNCIQIESFGMQQWKKTAEVSGFYRPFVALDLASAYDHQFQLLEALKLPYSQQRKIYAKAIRNYEKSQCSLSTLGLSLYLYRYQSKVLEAMAWCRLTRAAVEARSFHEKNNRWPSNVGELPQNKPDDYTDPFADQGPLQIKPEGKGIRITSLGPVEDATQNHPAGRRSLDWVLK